MADNPVRANTTALPHHPGEELPEFTPILSEKVQLARIQALQKMPYLASLVYSLKVVITRVEVPFGRYKDANGKPYNAVAASMASDNGGRLYLDPRNLAEQSVEVLGGILLHEALHILFNHGARGTNLANTMGISQQEWHGLMNICADFEINDNLAQMDVIPFSLPKKERFGVMAEDMGYENNDFYEAYFGKSYEKALAEKQELQKEFLEKLEEMLNTKKQLEELKKSNQDLNKVTSSLNKPTPQEQQQATENLKEQLQQLQQASKELSSLSENNSLQDQNTKDQVQEISQKMQTPLETLSKSLGQENLPPTQGTSPLEQVQEQMEQLSKAAEKMDEMAQAQNNQELSKAAHQIGEGAEQISSAAQLAQSQSNAPKEQTTQQTQPERAAEQTLAQEAQDLLEQMKKNTPAQQSQQSPEEQMQQGSQLVDQGLESLINGPQAGLPSPNSAPEQTAGEQGEPTSPKSLQDLAVQQQLQDIMAKMQKPLDELSGQSQAEPKQPSGSNDPMSQMQDMMDKLGQAAENMQKTGESKGGGQMQQGASQVKQGAAQAQGQSDQSSSEQSSPGGSQSSQSGQVPSSPGEQGESSSTPGANPSQQIQKGSDNIGKGIDSMLDEIQNAIDSLTSGQPGEGSPSDISQKIGQLLKKHGIERYQDCGSSADGQKRSWDLAENDKQHPALNDGQQDLINRKVAQDMVKYNEDQEKKTGRGTLPAFLERWAKEILSSKVDWRKQLQGAIRTGLGQMAIGKEQHTYSRLPRRTTGTYIQPGVFKYEPNISIIVDTSGSMSQQDIGQALGEVKGIIKSMGLSNVMVIACDADVAAVSRVSKLNDLKLAGGGGTDMGVGINYAATKLRPRPDGIIVLTDGGTPWPATIPNRIPVVACVIGNGNDFGVPSHIRSVTIDMS